MHVLHIRILHFVNQNKFSILYNFSRPISQTIVKKFYSLLGCHVTEFYGCFMWTWHDRMIGRYLETSGCSEYS